MKKFLFVLFVFCGILFSSEFEFTLTAPNAEKVFIAGEFNDWNPEKDEMIKGEDGVFRIKLDLEPGFYEYKYVINGEWLPGANFLFDANIGKTIKFSNFAPSPKIFWGGFFLVNFTTSSRKEDGHLYGKITFNRNIGGFFSLRGEGTSSEREFSLEKANMKIQSKNFFLIPFYNVAVIQSEDPMRMIERKKIPLRMEKVLFHNEKNPSRNFGLGEQGIYAGWKGISFLLSDGTTGRDIFWAQFASGNFGFSFLEKRGIRFILSNDWDWFPDPEEKMSWLGGTNTPVWYRGFVEEREISANLKRDFKDVNFFFQVLSFERKLQSVRWNEGVGVDSSSDKYWKFYEAWRFYGGARWKILEYAFFTENGRFSDFWNFHPRIQKHKFTIKTEGKNLLAGLRFVAGENKKISGYDVPEEYDPYRVEYYPGYTKVYHRWQEFLGQILYRGRGAEFSLTGKFLSEENLFEAVGEVKIPVGIFSFEFSPRYFRWDGRNFLTPSFSAGVLLKNLEIRLGTGMTGEEFSPFDEYDRREEFLYNQSDIVSGEEALQEQEKIWLRAILRFGGE